MAYPAIIRPESGGTAGAGSTGAFGFEWEDNDYSVRGWSLIVGSSAMASDYFNSGVLPVIQLGVMATGLPTSGTIYVRLRWCVGGGTGWAGQSYTYGVGDPPAMPKNARTFDWFEQGRWYQCERCGFTFHESDTAIDPKSGLRVCTIGPNDLDEHEFGIHEMPITSRRDPTYRGEAD